MPNGSLIIGGAIVLSTILNIVTRERVKFFMGSAELTEGEPYTVLATTKNLSTKAGVPVAATLTIRIAAVVNSQVILDDTEVYSFAAEETHPFGFPMVVPMGAGGKVGAVTAIVYDPNGNKIADGSLNIEVVPIGVAEFVYVSGIRYYPLDISYCRMEIDVQNVGNVAGVCSVKMYRRFRDGPHWSAWKLFTTDPRHYPTDRFWEATLAPGEIVTFRSNGVITHIWTIDERAFKVTGTPGEIIRDGIPEYIW